MKFFPRTLLTFLAIFSLTLFNSCQPDSLNQRIQAACAQSTGDTPALDVDGVKSVNVDNQVYPCEQVE